MKTSVSIALLLLTFSMVHAGPLLVSVFQREVRLKRDEPSVYISFERVGQLNPPSPVDDKERVWLRLHNNTKWSIMLQMSAVPSQEYGDASLFYDELAKGEVVFRNQCHVCTLNSLGPGKTLLFSLPRNILERDGGAIRVRFSYSWENQNDVAGGREVEHYVYFDRGKLPQSAQKTAVGVHFGNERSSNCAALLTEPDLRLFSPVEHRNRGGGSGSRNLQPNGSVC